MARYKKADVVKKYLKAKRMEEIKWTWDKIVEWIDELAETDPDVTIESKNAARLFLADMGHAEIDGFSIPANCYVTKFDEIRFVWDPKDGSVVTFTRHGEEVWADLESFRIKDKKK